MAALRRLGPFWQVQRHRRPAAAARVEQAALALRGRDALVAQVRTLRTRVAELERDHLLLAAHVAVLTERLGAGETAGTVDDEAARSRARLAAVAFYEERIGALEQRLQGQGRSRRARSAASARPSGERLEAAS